MSNQTSNLKWQPLKYATGEGWYVIRFAWDTHHENNTIGFKTGRTRGQFHDIDIRDSMIGLGPWGSKEIAAQIAGVEL